MLQHNLNIIVEQARQRRQELLDEAERHRRVQCVLRNQSSIFRQSLTWVGELLVICGEWLKAQGELPGTRRTVATR